MVEVNFNHEFDSFIAGGMARDVVKYLLQHKLWGWTGCKITSTIISSVPIRKCKFVD